MTKKISIIGCGQIGCHWATIFGSAGYRVEMFDVDQDAKEKAMELITQKLLLMEIDGLLRSCGKASSQIKNISITDDLQKCLENSFYCQECIAEDLEAKKEIFKNMDRLAPEKTILASSTSTIPASQFTENLHSRSRCLVVHPVNPPIYIPLVEVVPTPWTSEHVITETIDIMQNIGQSPVRLKKEVLGFALNRIQYAINAEAWKLVRDGILSPEDVDTVMKDGLGCRYAFYGPFEIMHTNANGINDYMERYGNGMQNVLESFERIPTFKETETLLSVGDALENQLPVYKMPEHLRARDRRLAELCKIKRQLESDVENGV